MCAVPYCVPTVTLALQKCLMGNFRKYRTLGVGGMGEGRSGRCVCVCACVSVEPHSRTSHFTGYSIVGSATCSQFFFFFGGGALASIQGLLQGQRLETGRLNVNSQPAVGC